MGIRVSVGPRKVFMQPQAVVLPVRRNRYVIHVNFAVYLKTGPGPKDLEFFGGDRVILWAPNRVAWVNKLIDRMFDHELLVMSTEREDMLHAAARALPRHLTRLLLREAMRRRGPLRQKLRRSLAREHALIWKKPKDTPADWDAFHTARNTSTVTRYRLAVVSGLMRDLGQYLPTRERPPQQTPRTQDNHCDLNPPQPRRRLDAVDRSDCIRPESPPPSE